MERVHLKVPFIRHYAGSVFELVAPIFAMPDGKESWILSVAFGIFVIALAAITYPILLGALFRFVREQFFKS